jgi:hypothetical protein
MTIERVGEVRLTIKCNNCETLDEIIIPNKEWESLTEVIETIHGSIPAINITCPNCKYYYLMSLF